ncbi:hypothetical protein ACFLR5_00590 [Elusimicrobiota bacterium]
MEDNKIEINELSEREILVGENRIYLSEDKIIYFVNIGPIDEKIALKSCEVMLKLRDMSRGKVHFFIDLNEGGKTTAKARSILKEFTENNIHGKLAFWGMHPVAYLLSSFFMGITKKKDMRFFKTEEEALIWLKR